MSSTKEESLVQEQPDGSLVLSGRLPVDDFEELTGVSTGDWDTVGGFVFGPVGVLDVGKASSAEAQNLPLKRSIGDTFNCRPSRGKRMKSGLLPSSDVRTHQTLINQILGTRVSIVSDKPQTTRLRVMGVLHRETSQIVFVDTPGIHKPVTQLGERLRDR